MQIIIEYVLLDNFLIDAMLLYITNKIIKHPINRLGLITASMFGAGFAVLSPLIPVDGIWAVMVKFGVAGTMVFMLDFTFKKILLKFCLFCGLTFAFGGTLIAVFNFLGVSVYDSLYIGYVSTLPLGTILVSAIVFFVMVMRGIRAVFFRRQFRENTCEIEITVNRKSAKILGFVDSGNVLRTSLGKSVIVVNEDTLAYWFSPYERVEIMMGKQNLLSHCEDLTVSSLGGEYKIRAFDCQITVLGKGKESALGVAPNKIHYGNCKAIIAKELLEV